MGPDPVGAAAAGAQCDNPFGLCPAGRPFWNRARGASRSILGPRVSTVLTQDSEACGARANGGLDGLALVHGVVLQLCSQDLQVMLP